MPVFRTVSPAALDARLREMLGRTAVNNTGVTILGGRVCAWLDNNTVGLASATATVTSDIAGVTTEDVPNGTEGYFQKTGRIAGVLAGLGAVAGQPVFLSETPGLLTLTAPTPYTSAVIRIGYAEPSDGVSTPGEAADLQLMIEAISEP
jgi:hypothetical protein